MVEEVTILPQSRNRDGCYFSFLFRLGPQLMGWCHPTLKVGAPITVNPGWVWVLSRWTITGTGVQGATLASRPAAGRMAPSLRLWPLAGLSPSVQTLSLSITPAQTAAWRKQIFQQLTERTKRELESFRHYEQAVEQVGPAGPAVLFLCL